MLTRDRRDEAWSIVKRLHGGADDDEAALQYAREEFYQMTHQVQADMVAWKAGGGWAGMLKNRSYQKRFWMGFFIQYAAQSTGAQVIYGKREVPLPNATQHQRAREVNFWDGANNLSVYIVSLYQNLGLTGGVPLILGAAYVTVATISNFVGALLLDKVGRKPLLRKLFCCCSRVTSEMEELNRPSDKYSHRAHRLYALRVLGDRHDRRVCRYHKPRRTFDGGVFLLLLHYLLWRWH